MAQICDIPRRLYAIREMGTAHRKDLFAAQTGHVKVGPAPLAMAHRHVDVLVREVDVVQARADPKVDRRVVHDEAAEPMHQPLGREVR